MAFFLFAIEPAYASGTIQAYVTIPNTDPQPTPSPEESLDPNPTIPALIELDAIKIVNANEMALISVEARKVEMAKTPDGARLVAKDLVLNKYGWSTTQFGCLNKLWTKESNWRYKARNKTSGAHGIAQALPATKMEVVGTDWRTNPVTQITWGLKYITERYETPCKALRKHNRSRWY
jgi:pyruvate dehydrogenase complex dehydrogenase (E1) component